MTERKQYEKTKEKGNESWLTNQVSSDNNVFNDHRYAIVASNTLMVYLLMLSQRVDKNITIDNGELHIVYDEKGNEIWRIK